jgi:CATRA-Associated Small Protein
MALDGTNWDATDWREASAEARALLRTAIEWRLEDSRWQQVQDAVEGMEASLAAADVESLWNAIAQVEQLGPLRVSTRLGDTPKEPAPEDVRERINELIDALVREDGPAPGDSGDNGQDSDHGTSAG